MRIGLITILAVCLSLACTNKIKRPENNQGLHIVDQLISSLDGRRSWSVTGVKIHLKSPDVVVTCGPLSGTHNTIHAWPENQNDFNVPMIRINAGNILYQISEDEFSKLKELNENIPTTE